MIIRPILPIVSPPVVNPIIQTFVAENMIVRYSLDGKSWETTLGQFNLIGNRTINPNSSSIFYVSIALADRTKNANLHEMVTKISLSIDDLLI